MSDRSADRSRKDRDLDRKFDYLNQMQADLSRISQKNTQTNFLHKDKTAVFMRRIGFGLYVVVLGFLLLVTPGKNDQIEFLAPAFCWLKGLESLVVNSGQPARIVAWYLLTILMYPLAHKVIDANRTSSHLKTNVIVKAICFWLLLLAIFTPFLVFPGWDNEFTSRRAVYLNAIRSSHVGLALLAPLISIVISILFYIPIQAMQSIFNKTRS